MTHAEVKERPASLDRLVGMSRVELDRLFATLPAGPIPDGPSTGAALVYWTSCAGFVRWLVFWFLWQGKVFTRFGDRECGTLMNKVSPLRVRAIVARVAPAQSWLDEKPCILLDYSKTSLLASKIRDEIRLVRPGLYLGKVWWGRTRLLDFALRFATDSEGA